MTDLISAGNLFLKSFSHSSITKQGIIHEMVQFFSEYSAMYIHRYSQMNTLKESLNEFQFRVFFPYHLVFVYISYAYFM